MPSWERTALQWLQGYPTYMRPFRDCGRRCQASSIMSCFCRSYPNCNRVSLGVCDRLTRVCRMPEECSMKPWLATMLRPMRKVRLHCMVPPICTGAVGSQTCRLGVEESEDERCDSARLGRGLNYRGQSSACMYQYLLNAFIQGQAFLRMLKWYKAYRRWPLWRAALLSLS